MPSKLYWLDETWPGRVALAARPRGGEWLGDEIADWKRGGIDTVFSLLTPEEEQELDLVGEAAEPQSQGLVFSSFPIPDRQVPESETKLAGALEKVTRALSRGKNILLHCRQGVGRSGMVAACLLVTKGLSPGVAVEKVSAARGVSIPDTTEQRDWIDHYAAAVTK